MIASFTTRRRSYARGVVSGLVLGLLLVVTAAVAPAQTSEQLRSITVGAEPDYPPYSFLDENGVPTGFSVDLFRAVARTMGLNVELYTDYWVNIKGDLAEGRIDALPLVGRTPEREELFDFTFPYLSLHGGIVVRSDDNRFTELDDLHGARVAVMAGDNAEEFLRRHAAQQAQQQTGQQAESYTIATFPTFAAALEDLAAGTSDAVVIQRLVALRLLRQEGFSDLRLLDQPINEFRQDFCFAVTKGNSDLLAKLNEGLALVISDGTLRRLETVWFSPLELPSRNIIVGGDHDYPPFEYLDDAGNPAGYNVELIRAIAREMGLNVEIRLGPWTQITSMVEHGEIDLLQGMMYTAERDRIFDFSQAHTVHQHVAIGRRAGDGRAGGGQAGGGGRIPSTEEELRGHRIVVQAGDVMHEFVRENGLTDNLVVVESQGDALEMVLTGEADYALGSRLTALYLIDENGWDSLRVGQHSLVNSEYGFAVRQGNTGLLSYFAEGLAVVTSTGEYRRIHNRWLGAYTPPEYDLGRVIRALLVVVAPAVLILVAVVIWNHALRKQVDLRTAELTASLEEKQILIKEIHHRVKNNLNVVVSLLRLQEDQIDSVETARAAFEQSRNRIYSMALVHESLYQSDSLADIQLDEYINTLVNQLQTNNLRDGDIAYRCNLTPVRLDITQAIPCGIIINELVTNAQKHAFTGLAGGEITVSVEVPDTGGLIITVEDNGQGLPEFNGAAVTSLGLHLVRVLTDQLDGSVSFGPGTASTNAAGRPAGDAGTGTRVVLTLP